MRAVEPAGIRVSVRWDGVRCAGGAPAVLVALGRLEVEVGRPDRRLAVDAGGVAGRDPLVAIDAHGDAHLAVDGLHGAHDPMVDPEVRDLGVGGDAGGGGELALDLVGPPEEVEADDVVDRPPQHEHEHSDEGDEVEKAATRHQDSTSASRNNWAKSLGPAFGTRSATQATPRNR